MNIDDKHNVTVHHGIICAVIALLFFSGALLDRKICHILFFHIPAAAWFFIFIYPLCDAVTEVYGPRKTWIYLITGYLVCCLFMLLTILTIQMPYSGYANAKVASVIYPYLEQAMMMCFGWGFFIFFIGMFINLKLLGRWKLRYTSKYYYLRSYCASAVSEGFVVIMANLLIWYGRVTFSRLFFLICTTYLLKLILTFGWALVGNIIKNILYYIEGEDKIYKFNLNFHNRLKEMVSIN